MAELAPLYQRVIIFTLASFWGVVTVAGIFVAMVIRGPLGFFRTVHRPNRPLCLNDESLGVHSFIRLRNVRLHYVASGPEDEPLMLFLHGFPELWYSWRHQLREFSKHFRCVAIDMKGYGESEKPKDIQNYTLECLTEDVKDLITALDYEKCTIVAHDWGGLVAQCFAHFYPDMVERLVLCNIPHPLAMKTYVSRSFRQFIMSWYIFMFQLPKLPELFMTSYDYGFIKDVFRDEEAAGPDDREAYKWSLQQPDGLTGPINYYRALLQYKQKPLPRDPVSCPTLLLWGMKDIALSKEMAGMSGCYYKDFTLMFIETAAHWVQMEAPDETNMAIRNFLGLES